MLEGVVKDDSDGTFWARGVDERGQWTLPIVDLGVAWELYDFPLESRPHDSLVKYKRRPMFGTAAPSSVDMGALAEAVADKLAARLSA